MLATSGGRMLKFVIDDDQLPQMSRNSQGPKAIRLLKQETLVGCVPVHEGSTVVLISSKGFAKRLPAKALKLTNRGGIGSQSFKFDQKTDHLVAMLPGLSDGEMLLATDQDRMVLIQVDNIPRSGKTQPSDRVVTTGRSEAITVAWMGNPPSLD